MNLLGQLSYNNNLNIMHFNGQNALFIIYPLQISEWSLPSKESLLNWEEHVKPIESESKKKLLNTLRAGKK